MADRDIEQAGDTSMPLCNVAYQRPGGSQPGDRIVRCSLLAGHDGMHVETDTDVAWPDSVSGDYGNPAREHLAKTAYRDAEITGLDYVPHREHRDTAAVAGQVPAEAVEAAAEELAAIDEGPIWDRLSQGGKDGYRVKARRVLAAAAPLIAAAIADAIRDHARRFGRPPGDVDEYEAIARRFSGRKISDE